MFRSRLLACSLVWSAWVFVPRALADAPPDIDDPPPPSAAEDDPPPPSAADQHPPPSAAEDDPPPPSAAEAEGELFAAADQPAPMPPEPLGPPEPIPPPVPITTETVSTPALAPLPPDPTSDPDAAFPPAPPPSVDGQPIAAPPSTATPEPAPPPSTPSQPAAPPPSEATPPTEQPLFRVGALAGLGLTFDDTIGSINPLGFGFGLRGDYLLGDGVRVGARTLYFVGGHAELPTGTVEMSSWLLALEGAYTLELDPITLEPGLAIGYAERDRGGPPLVANGTAGYIPGSQHHVLSGFYLAPGVSGYLPLGELDRELEPLFIGIDARFDLVFSSTMTANLQLLFELGLRF
jgi:hypothetical protein